MRLFSRLASQKELIIYPQLLRRGGKPIYLLGTICFFVFIILGFYQIFYRGENTPANWEAMLLCSMIFCVAPLQLIWGPVLIVNERGLRIRSNPLLPRITLQWEEIASIKPYIQKNGCYFGITLVRAHTAAVLQRQSPLHRKILIRRLNRTYWIAYFSQKLLPSSYSLDTLLKTIQERYHAQIQQHHVVIQQRYVVIRERL